jgi:hypothetical protein
MQCWERKILTIRERIEVQRARLIELKQLDTPGEQKRLIRWIEASVPAYEKQIAEIEAAKRCACENRYEIAVFHE